ncbi:helix-turn-helix domain-containing protein [bacterium]|nr:helix-turn-helix domain-containing protein [candidate division CSSED10-310 bacterium]
MIPPRSKINLKVERELRGVSLRELSGATKIPESHLRALEELQFQNLPDSIFIRGYIRAYADYLGLDPDIISLEYEFFAQNSQGSGSGQKQKSRPILKTQPVLIFIAALAPLLLIFSFADMDQTERSYRDPDLFQSAVTILKDRTVEETLLAWSEMQLSIGESDSEKAAGMVLTSAGPIELKTVCSSWIRRSYPLEGREILETLLQNDVVEWTVESDLKMEIGNPDCVEICINGEILSLTGRTPEIIYFHPP